LLRLRLAELDTTAARLETADPGGAARFQAEVERKRAANLLQMEREAAAREGCTELTPGRRRRTTATNHSCEIAISN
jgi:hypothetical protein